MSFDNKNKMKTLALFIARILFLIPFWECFVALKLSRHSWHTRFEVIETQPTCCAQFRHGVGIFVNFATVLCGGWRVKERRRKWKEAMWTTIDHTDGWGKIKHIMQNVRTLAMGDDSECSIGRSKNEGKINQRALFSVILHTALHSTFGFLLLFISFFRNIKKNSCINYCSFLFPSLLPFFVSFTK